MNDEPKNVKLIFAEALEKSIDERAGYLDEVCSEDANLRSEVEELLKSHEQAGDFMEAPVPEAELALEGAALSLRSEVEGPFDRGLIPVDDHATEGRPVELHSVDECLLVGAVLLFPDAFFGSVLAHHDVVGVVAVERLENLAPLNPLDDGVHALSRFHLSLLLLSTPVRALEVELRPDRHHAGRIDRSVALVVVALDVTEVDGLPNPADLVEFAEVA